MVFDLPNENLTEVERVEERGFEIEMRREMERESEKGREKVRCKGTNATLPKWGVGASIVLIVEVEER